MLASILPGLRDLRVPLATGFLWLVAIWLLVYPVIPTQAEASGLAAEVYQALGALGPAALITVITFVAYIVGILMVRPGTALVQALLARGRGNRPRLSASSRTEALQLASRTADAMNDAGVELPRETQDEQGQLAELAHSLDADGVPGGFAVDSPSYVRSALTARMEREIPLVATRLLADNRDLFDRYDRAEAEAAFRFSVAVPLVVIGVLLPWRLGLEWWGYLASIAAGLCVAYFLLLEGSRKQMDSNDAIFQAVFVNKADFPSIETAKAAITQKQELDRQRQQVKAQRKAESEAREQARREAQDAVRDTQLQAEAEAAAEAGLVTVALAGGAGYGNPNEQKMNSVHVQIANDSARPVMIESVKLDPPLVAKRYPQFPIRMASHEAKTLTIEVEHVDVYSKELSGAPLSRFSTSVEYRLNGRTWSRNSTENSVPVPVTSAP